MIDYNDGNWHGWNGGECPVHPNSVVQVQLAHETRLEVMAQDEDAICSATLFNWKKLGNNAIIAFRVVTPYVEPPKPRECWSYGAHIRDTEADAIAFRQAVSDAHPGKGYENTPIIHWIEAPK